jgi:hypothetical protein
MRRILLLMVLAGVACHAATGTEGAGAAARLLASGDLQLYTVVDRSEIAPGDTARIAVILSNASDTAVSLTFGSSCVLLYEVRTAAGAEVPPEGGGTACLGVLTEVHLEPRESRTQTFAWTAREWTYPPYGVAPLPDGEYLVAGVLADSPELRSAPVTVRVARSGPFGARAGVSVSVAHDRQPTGAGSPGLLPGDTLRVTVTLANSTDAPVTLEFPSGCQLGFTLRDNEWRTLTPSPARACHQALSTRTVPANGSYSETLVWTAEYIDALGRVQPAPDGSYTLTGRIEGPRPFESPLAFVRVGPPRP